MVIDAETKDGMLLGCSSMIAETGVDLGELEEDEQWQALDDLMRKLYLIEGDLTKFIRCLQLRLDLAEFIAHS